MKRIVLLSLFVCLLGCSDVVSSSTSSSESSSSSSSFKDTSYSSSTSELPSSQKELVTTTIDFSSIKESAGTQYQHESNTSLLSDYFNNEKDIFTIKEVSSLQAHEYSGKNNSMTLQFGSQNAPGILKLSCSLAIEKVVVVGSDYYKSYTSYDGSHINNDKSMISINNISKEFTHAINEEPNSDILSFALDGATDINITSKPVEEESHYRFFLNSISFSYYL